MNPILGPPLLCAFNYTQRRGGTGLEKHWAGRESSINLNLGHTCRPGAAAAPNEAAPAPRQPRHLLLMCANACLGDFMVRQCALQYHTHCRARVRTTVGPLAGALHPEPRASRWGSPDELCAAPLKSWPPIQEPLIPLKQRFVTLRLHLGDKGAHTRGYVLGP